MYRRVLKPAGQPGESEYNILLATRPNASRDPGEALRIADVLAGTVRCAGRVRAGRYVAVALASAGPLSKASYTCATQALNQMLPVFAVPIRGSDMEVPRQIIRLTGLELFKHRLRFVRPPQLPEGCEERAYRKVRSACA